MDSPLNTLLKDHSSARFRGVGSNRPVLPLLYPETCAFHATTEDAPLGRALGIHLSQEEEDGSYREAAGGKLGSAGEALVSLAPLVLWGGTAAQKLGEGLRTQMQPL